MQKKINEADKSKKELVAGFLNMFGIDQGGQVCRKQWYRLCMQEQKKQERKMPK